MTTELVTNGGISPEPILPKEPEDIAHLLILGGVESPASRFFASEALQTELSKQDLRISALHQGDANAALWLTEAGIELISMAGLRNEGGEASAIGFIGVNTIGAGDTESMANRPYIHCINGIRLGVVALAEQTSEIFNSRADILSLAALDRVRMLLNQCDHVIVLVRSGLDQAELPLPEWRARYRRFIDAGASAVVDMGGNLVAQHRMNDSLLASISISFNKAYTAAALKMPTHEAAKLAVPGQPLFGLNTTDGCRLVVFGGGFPIVEDGTIVGGLGVSGGSVDEDMLVAQAGLAAAK